MQLGEAPPTPQGPLPTYLANTTDMCGRFSQADIAELDREVLWILDGLQTTTPRYNVAPSQEAAVIRHGGLGNRIDLLRWGLIPSWAHDPKIGYRTINARAESLTQKPAFRDSFATRRCAIPVAGFYEWRKTPHGKHPHFIRRRDRRAMLLAGLWDRWIDRVTGPLETFTIITTTPNAVVRPLHDRMPVVLPESGLLAWLDPRTTDSTTLGEFLVPCADQEIEAYRVSTHVNSPANEDPRCVEPVEP